MFHVCLVAVGCNDDVIRLYLKPSETPAILTVRIKANTWDDLVQLQEFVAWDDHVVFGRKKMGDLSDFSRDSYGILWDL